MSDKLTTPISIPELSSSPSNPGSGYQKIYAKTDGKLYVRNSSGTETQLTNVAGGGVYSGSGNIPDATEATLASAGTFAINWNSGNPALFFDGDNNEIVLSEDESSFPATVSIGSGYLALSEADLEIGDGNGVLFYEPSGPNFSKLQATTQSTNITYTLPSAAPTVNGQALTATTAGAMSWTTISGGSGISEAKALMISSLRI